MRKSMLLLIALVVGTVATVVANQFLNASTGPAETTTTEIFVAAAAIDIGEAITPEKVRLEQWPADKIPEGSSGDFAQLEKRYAKQRFFTGEPIMPVKLMDENWTTVPKGYSVVAMRASDVSIANLIQPGDRVDVLSYFEKSDLIPQTMTKTVLMGIRVYALDGDTQRRAGEDRPKSVRNIQLLINKKDQQAWSYAGELGRIQLALGSDADYTNDDGSNEAAADFLSWIEEFRIKQEEARLRAEQDKRRGNRPYAQPTKPSKPVEEGFSMFKLVEGRMVEYWIVPGKMPVRVGEVGGEDEVNAEGEFPLIGEQPASTTKSGSKDADEYSYLNGEDSPLFQPPTNRRGSRVRTNYQY
ncbi:Flp pilus assembly protein CpaB [Rubripirellula obstinata]|nr:Flp pilus assembly protein CpaB [Rubripirellula obstinata]